MHTSEKCYRLLSDSHSIRGSLCFPMYRHAPMLPICFTSKLYPHVYPTHPPVCMHSPYLSYHSTVQCILGSKCILHSHHSIHHLGHKDKLQGGRVKFMVVWLKASCYAKQCHGSARLDWKENSGEQNATMPWII